MKYNPPYHLVDHDTYRGKIPVRPPGYFVGIWEKLGYPILSPHFGEYAYDYFPKSWIVI